MQRTLFFVLTLALAGCEADVVDRDPCGDGFLDPGEACDGLEFGDQECTTFGYPWGQLACTPGCRLDLSGCGEFGRCGNGLRENQEQCDGEDLAAQDCEGLGYYGGYLSCDTDCTFLLGSCASFGRCGDSIIDADQGESCDNLEFAGLTCTTLGYNGGELVCGDDCRIDDTGCQETGRCGDGTIQTGFEDCEGDLVPAGSTCESLGYYGGTLACGLDCRFDLAGCEAFGRCGDGVAQPEFGETCDGTDFLGSTCLDHGQPAGTLVCAASCAALADDCGSIQHHNSGISHACLVVGDGTVKCWGSNQHGEMGFISPTDFQTPQPVPGLTGVTQVSLGTYHTCALRNDQTVHCWGANNAGQLGDGTMNDHAAPMAVFGVANAIGISSGHQHTCTRLSSGVVRCWGDNGDGQLGDGTTVFRPAPVEVGGLTNVLEVDAGTRHTCAILSGGNVRCWGDNGSGQLGDGTTTGRLLPVNVVNLGAAISISSSYSHTCAVLSGGGVRCWGNNMYGELGNGTTTSSPTPVDVINVSGAILVSTNGRHACALLSNGQVRCWGVNMAGCLGDGSSVWTSSVAVTVQNLDDAVSLSSGFDFNCVKVSNGRLRCWGWDYGGRLGNGPLLNSTPFPGDVLPQ